MIRIWQRRITRSAVAVAVAAFALGTINGPATAAGAEPIEAISAAVPIPEEDPFFAVPTDLGGVPNGTILRYRQVDLGWPMPATAWQLLYKTLDHHDRPTATVTTVLVPLLGWSGAGPRPVLSYQVAEDGVAGKCAPSYALTAGAAAATSNSALEVPLILTAVLKGWIVAVPDYEGPHSLFLSAKMEGHAVLDGVRAVRNFKRLAISPSAPIGLMGYSGGAYASSLAAQQQPTYAPELRFSAVALGGLVADVRSTIDGFDGSALGGAIPMGISSVARANPEAGILDLLTPEGVEKVEASSHDCINDAAARNPFFQVAAHEAVPDALDTPPHQAAARRQQPALLPGHAERSGLPLPREGRRVRPLSAGQGADGHVVCGGRHRHQEGRHR